MEEYTYILPTLVEGQDKISGPAHTVKDITFDTWFKAIQESIEANGARWSYSQREDVKNLVFKALTSFCSHPDKIKRMQDIFKALALYEEPRDFIHFLMNQSTGITPGLKTEDVFLRDGHRDVHTMTPQDLWEYAKALQTKMGSIEKIEPLKPYLEYLKSFRAHQDVQNIHDFVGMLNCDLRFTTYLSSGFTNNRPDLGLKIHKWRKTCNEYPLDSPQVRSVAIESVQWSHPSDVVFITDEGKEVSIDSKDYFKGWQHNPWYSLVIPNYLIAQVLGITIKEFVANVIPPSSEPLKFEVTLGKAEIRISVEDSLNQLELIDDRKQPSMVVVSQKDISSVFPQRNDSQKSIIGKTHRVACSVEEVKRIKDKLFRPFQTHFQKSTLPVFEKFLTELRYLVIAVDYFKFSKAAAHTMLFPKIESMEENRTNIVAAKNPVLIHDKKTLHVIANDVVMGEGKRVIMITGPNQNGKSRYMDTIALSQIAFQAGWPIFADKAEMSPKTDLCVHYVHSGVGITGESRFSHECERMHALFSGIGEYPLFLLDEPYTGTNPADAQTLMEEIQQAVSESKATLVQITHFHGLIKNIDELPNGYNMHCVVGENGEFTYKIQPGSSTITNALEVAESKGVRYQNIKQLLSGKLDKVEIVEDIETNNENDDLPF